MQIGVEKLYLNPIWIKILSTLAPLNFIFR